MNDDERGRKALQESINILMQYYDTVQIFVTKNQNEQMAVAESGGQGSLFARLGQIRIWIKKIESILIAPDDMEGGDEEDGGEGGEEEGGSGAK